MFTFRLYLEDGEDVGSFATSEPSWQVGDEFRSGDGHRFRILNIVPQEDLGTGGFYGLWVVTPLELAEP